MAVPARPFQYYTRLQDRIGIGWQTARVATARKLARIIYQMLRTNQPSCPAPNASKTQRDELRRNPVAAPALIARRTSSSP